MSEISERNTVSLDQICYLISDKYVSDDVGNQMCLDSIERLTFCAELPTMSSEYFRASQQDIIPNCTLIVNSYGYNDEKRVKYKDKFFRIYRYYKRADEMTELYLEEEN